MTERRRSAGHLSVKKAAAPKTSAPRGPAYTPPEHWYTTTLGELLGGLRSTPEFFAVPGVPTSERPLSPSMEL
ncbi:MAG TPA: hypothetical protein VEZ71_20405, partial [Archangium sp.]|nr:hypothetical protein [Archangium sp.]